MTIPVALLVQVLSEGRRAWPGVELSRDQLHACLVPRGQELASVSNLHAADLYLACASLCGSPTAQRHLESLCRSELGFAVHRLRIAIDEDEAVVAVLGKLLMGNRGGEPKLNQYAGRSELRRWIQVVMVHHIADTRPFQWREVPLTEAMLAEIASSEAPEWKALDAPARQAFKDALAAALEALPLEDRNLLRHRLEGLSLSAIGTLYRVNLSTVSRWIGRVSAEVEHETLCRLRESLQLEQPDLDSLVRSLLGQLDSSVRVAVAQAFRGEQR
jgi:RNA polymerase sigma-70 factor